MAVCHERPNKERRCDAVREMRVGPSEPAAQGGYEEAKPLYRRSLGTFERALGPEHPHVAQSLENYAALLRQTARADEAERMEARAKAIRAKSE